MTTKIHMLADALARLKVDENVRVVVVSGDCGDGPLGARHNFHERDAAQIFANHASEI